MKLQWITPLAAAILPLVAGAQQTVKAPKFEVDPLWPKPMPNHWLLGSASGLAIEKAGRAPL